MISNFPRIHGLSTLGIIYHFNTDYKFHQFRTDFSGDGGSGKTMIADMIQLILVGPAAYISATEGKDARPIEGMVLPRKGQQHGAGYIILNIEIAPSRFLAIGCFIEKASKQAKMFIVQKGFGWDKTLEPLLKPVYYSDLLIDNKILSIEDLNKEVNHIHIKSMPIKNYHHLLYENHILSVDLTDKKRLESYASIFRAFSRGKGFNTDSASLKTFLFGNGGKAMFANYNQQIKSISDDYEEHDRYRMEISIIQSKQNYIREIFGLQNIFKETEKKYYVQKVHYWFRERENCLNEYKNLALKYNVGKIEQLCLSIKEAEMEFEEASNQIIEYKTSQENLEKVQQKSQQYDILKQRQYTIFQESQKKIDALSKFETLLQENDNIVTKVQERIDVEISYNSNYALLQEFIEYLHHNEIYDIFLTSRWASNFDLAERDYKLTYFSDKEKESNLATLAKFSDLDNEDSLAGWAINYFADALSLQQESVLMHFQKLEKYPPNIPLVSDRYLPFPEELFNELIIYPSSSEAGFWLNLDGVYEYIQYVPRQYLNLPRHERERLKSSLSDLSFGVKAELQKLQGDILYKENLKSVLFRFANLAKAIELFSRMEEYVRKIDFRYIMQDSDFIELSTLHNNRNDSDADYQRNKEEYELTVKNETLVDPNNFRARFKVAEAYFKKKNIDTSELNYHAINLETKIDELRNELKAFQSYTAISDLEVSTINSSALEGIYDRLTLAKLQTEKLRNFVIDESAMFNGAQRLQECETKFNKSKEDFQNVFKTICSLEDIALQYDDPDENHAQSLKSILTTVKIKFEEKYNLITEQIEEGSQLRNTYHVGQLAHRLLPTVFPTPASVTGKDVDFLIAQKLEALQQLMKEIGSRKLEILMRVFADVLQTYREHVIKAGEIEKYFKNPSKKITGGNSASLKVIGSLDYPAKWMNVFTKLLGNELSYVGLFEQLAKEVDINDMMKRAFIAEGGTQMAGIEDLLDPKSYFDLDFKLKLESGDNNSGSNSQTYSANALLGLARLSLIEDPKRRGIKIMPIDEAQGLGSNYEMLRSIAIEERYQILSMSIETAGEIREGEQYIYLLSDNALFDENNYVPAMGIFSEGIITENINDYLHGQEN
jgi:exonuclease SbcC